MNIPLMLLFGIFIVLLLIGAPTYLALLVSSLVYFYFHQEISSMSILQKMFGSLDSFVLIARMENLQGNLKDGDTVLCKTPDGETVLRTYFRRPDGICLHPENPACDDVFVPFEAFIVGKARIIGKVICRG